MLAADPAEYRRRVDASLRRQIELIGVMAGRGTHFWDYGNSFLKAVFEAGVREVAANGADTKEGFIYPSYVEHIMGPLCFDRGYGPFRWVCASLDPADLARTDAVAMACIDPERCWQDRDNYNWVRDAGKNKLVVGSQARILYSDAEGRVRIALAFNDLVRRGEIGPVIIGRDHHDVSGTDSPYRETSNIYDGSNIMADMAFHCWAGNAARGMTLVVASNGGGVGIGRSINTGFGLVLDGSTRVDGIIRSAVEWDVMGGVARRAWARNEPAMETAAAWNRANASRGQITLPAPVADGLVEGVGSWPARSEAGRHDGPCARPRPLVAPSGWPPLVVVLALCGCRAAAPSDHRERRDDHRRPTTTTVTIRVRRARRLPRSVRSEASSRWAPGRPCRPTLCTPRRPPTSSSPAKCSSG